MRKILYLLCGLLFSNVGIVLALATNVDVGYNVPVVCSINNLPSSVNINTLAGKQSNYVTNFQVLCNTSDMVSLKLSSLNQSDSDARLLSLDGRYLNYQVTVNNVIYVMGISNQIMPNISNSLSLSIDAPVYAGKYQDSLIFTVLY